MSNLLEYAGCIHIFLGPYRGNPIALYLKRTDHGCEIGPRVYPWNDVVGKGETPNKAAADFEEKWKTRGLTPDMYSGPAWDGGIKPEKPAPPKPASPDAKPPAAEAKPTATPKPAAAAAAPTANAAPAATNPPPLADAAPKEPTAPADENS